jgi:hypothetical protein
MSAGRPAANRWVMTQHGLESSYAVALAMAGLAAVCGLPLVLLRRGIRAR